MENKIEHETRGSEYIQEIERERERERERGVEVSEFL